MDSLHNLSSEADVNNKHESIVNGMCDALYIVTADEFKIYAQFTIMATTDRRKIN